MPALALLATPSGFGVRPSRWHSLFTAVYEILGSYIRMDGIPLTSGNASVHDSLNYIGESRVFTTWAR
jgi:hypothetical protein